MWPIRSEDGETGVKVETEDASSQTDNNELNDGKLLPSNNDIAVANSEAFTSVGSSPRGHSYQHGTTAAEQSESEISDLTQRLAELSKERDSLLAALQMMQVLLPPCNDKRRKFFLSFIVTCELRRSFFKK